jgi:hypothetical protein
MLTKVKTNFLFKMKRGLISTPPSDMLPTTEGGKSNAWLRQKNAGIYVRPRLFSPYVEEAKVIKAFVILDNFITNHIHKNGFCGIIYLEIDKMYSNSE